MNQRADSWKKNLQLNVAKPLIDRRGWLLSHTMRCGIAENRIETARDDSFGCRFFFETAAVTRTNRVRPSRDCLQSRQKCGLESFQSSPTGRHLCAAR